MQQLAEFALNHWMLVTAFCALVGILAANLLASAGGISPLAAVAMINRAGAVVVDIRSSQDFAGGHIVDAVNIPLADLRNAADRLKKHNGKPLLVCCAAGHQAGQGVRDLKALGFSDVHVLKGGIAGWRSDNLPLAKG
jgi:rhodanese-related sulfurtransferase